MAPSLGLKISTENEIVSLKAGGELCRCDTRLHRIRGAGEPNVTLEGDGVTLRFPPEPAVLWYHLLACG